jgi:uncharacterized protein (TIGR00730 family)
LIFEATPFFTEREIMTGDDKKKPETFPGSHGFEVLETALFDLWRTASTLSVLLPPRSDRYRVTVFGSARVQKTDALYGEVKTLASRLSSMGCDIVTGGGPGLMQAANEGENEGDPHNKTRSIGVRIELPFEQGANPHVEASFSHPTFFSRLHHFLRLSNAFVIVNGGIGTALESLMVWQLLQVGHLRDVPLVFVGRMWRELIEWARVYMGEHSPALICPQDLNIPKCVESIEEAVALIERHKQAWENQ